MFCLQAYNEYLKTGTARVAVLAQGGHIRFERASNGRVMEADCFTHNGMIYSDMTLEILQRLKRKRLIESRNSSPYRISDKGRRSVRARTDNRI